MTNDREVLDLINSVLKTLGPDLVCEFYCTSRSYKISSQGECGYRVTLSLYSQALVGKAESHAVAMFCVFFKNGFPDLDNKTELQLQTYNRAQRIYKLLKGSSSWEEVKMRLMLARII